MARARAPRAAVAVAVAVAAVVARGGAAVRAAPPDDDLAAWLAQLPPEPARWTPDVVARRRGPDLVARLVRVAVDPGAPIAVRERAVDLLGSVGDEPGLGALLRALVGDPALGPAATAALLRLEPRARALERLALVARGEVPARAVAEDAVGVVAGELAALVRDPLLAPHLRRAAAAALEGALPADPGVDDVLAAVAGAAEGEVRDAALAALAGRRSPQALPAGLAAVLLRGPPGPEERALVARLAPRLDPREGVDALLRRVLAPEVGEAARAAAARALGLAGHARAAPRLRAALRAGGGRALQATLAAALLRLEGYDAARDGDPAPLLVGAAVGAGVEAEDAADALALLPPATVEAAVAAALGGGLDLERRARALDLVYALHLAGLAGAAVEVAEDRDAPFALRLAAVQALAAVGDAGGATLVRVLAQVEPGPAGVVLRRAAADALGALGGERPGADAQRAALEAALDDEAPGVRRAALRALASRGDPRAGPRVRAALERAARTTDDRLARTRAAARLGLVDAEAAARVLGARLEDPDPALGLALVDYARGVGDRAALAALVDLLGHRAAEVREAALAELRRRGGPGFGLDPLAAPSTQQDALGRWRAWAADRLR